MKMLFGFFDEDEKEVLEENRRKVKNSYAQEYVFSKGEMLVLHTFENDGMYRTKYIRFESMSLLAKALKSDKKHKLLCNGNDFAVLCTMYDMVDITVLEKMEMSKLLEVM